jgi:hypothetical protein
MIKNNVYFYNISYNTLLSQLIKHKNAILIIVNIIIKLDYVYHCESLPCKG